MQDTHFDWVIVGSGFGGSVSALRLSQKGYRVLVVEKGRRWSDSEFPKSNWNLRRYLWWPAFGLRGIQQITFLRHVSILSGVGVGGGSLVYANTLPVPKPEFFHNGSWAGLADWEEELGPHYRTAQRMLGATRNPRLHFGEEVIRDIGRDLGREEHFEPTEVSVYFGEAGETVPDPFFDGEGPERTGCIECGGCMIGCRHNAKNTLVKNYLYLAEKLGCTVLAETEITAIRPRDEGGYQLEGQTHRGWLRTEPVQITADRVVLSGGVLGTVDLLLRMRDDPRGLPDLSPRTGDMVRTNSESILYLVSSRRDADQDQGIAIGAILHTDDYSHVEPVRYPRGSGMWRLLLLPHAPGDRWCQRLGRALAAVLKDPIRSLRAIFVPDLARYSTVLLYMRTLEGTLRFERAGWWLRRWFAPVSSRLPANAEPPRASIPEATDLARRFAEKTGSLPMAAVPETLFNAPTTAHILGGACIGADAEHGVIGPDHQVHGYPGLYVCDGAAVSANPGVNPSLTITAMTERAMAGIEARPT